MSAPAVYNGDETEDVGGYFTASGRKAALNQALPLLASYFADAQTWNLEVSAQLATDEDADEEQDSALNDFAAGARLRASLAAADRLLTILSAVAAQPTFRYTQVSAESVGTIRGRLDVLRYSREQGRVDVPRRYPIRLVERENATAENILATYAALWLRRDLDAVPTHILPQGSPEYRELQRVIDALKRTLGIPVLAGTKPHAVEIWRRSALDGLIDEVNRRLDTGHVARPEPYQELVDWITETRSGVAVADVGDRPWSFYGDAFDTKLFEIWCLIKIAERIGTRLGDPGGPVRSLAARKQGPIYVWNIGVGKLMLHFQPSLKALATHGTTWSYSSGGPLRGFPDLALTTNTVTGSGLALLDPKLRRRTGAPTEEIYKLLGYFANLKQPAPPTGAILYYSPGTFTDYKLTSESGGEIHAVGLDPEATSMGQFDVAADLALKITGVGDEAIALLAKPVGDTPDERAEHVAGVRQAIAVEAMVRAAEALPSASLAPTRKQTATTLHAIWNRLPEQCKTMIVTAEYFANTAPDNADHSGPLLGLAAAAERLLRDTIFDPASQESRGIIRSGQTLGSCLTLLDNCLRGRTDPESVALRHTLLRRTQINRDQIRSLLPAARAMNRDYRIPAAHAEIVAVTTWVSGRDAILHPSSGVLGRLVRALGLPEPSA